MLYQPPPQEAYSPSQISIDGTNLNTVKHFTYLGSIIFKDATISKDLDNCLSKASSSFWRLSKQVLRSHLFLLSSKLQVYRAIVIPTLLCSAETWVFYLKQIRLLEQFHQHCLCSILFINGKTVSNKEVLKRAGLPSIMSIMLQVQLSWAGHITRIEDICMPKPVLFSKLQQGKHDHGAPRCKDQLKRQLAQAQLSVVVAGRP